MISSNNWKKYEHFINPNDILFITTHDPSQISGGCFATCALIRAFETIFKDNLKIIGVPGTINTVRHISENSIIEISERSFLTKLFYLFRLHSVDRTTPFVDNLLKTPINLPKFVFIDNGFIGRYAKVFRGLKVKSIVMHHNVQKDYNVSARPKLGFPVDQLSWNIINKNEYSAVKFSNLNLVFTKEDGKRLKNLYGNNSSKFELINIFDKDNFIYSSHYNNNKDVENIHIVITGSLCQPQTVDGVLWFVNNVYYQIKKYNNNFRLTIAGRQPGKEITKLNDHETGISIISDPTSMAPIIQSGDIYCAPIRLGSGIKLRVMDALKHGLFVLAHEISARGYQDIFPNDCLAKFSDASECITLLKNLPPKTYLNNRKNKIIEIFNNNYSFEAGVLKIIKILEKYNFKPRI